jgi:hypothetical protein
MADPAKREQYIPKPHKKTIAERFADKLKNDEDQEEKVLLFK